MNEKRLKGKIRSKRSGFITSMLILFIFLCCLFLVCEIIDVYVSVYQRKLCELEALENIAVFELRADLNSLLRELEGEQKMFLEDVYLNSIKLFLGEDGEIYLYTGKGE